MPKRITGGRWINGSMVKSKTQILAAKGDSLYPAVIPIKPVGGTLTIDCSVGAAAADGITAQVDRQLQIAATVGAATADGFTANVDKQLTIAATTGAATASGLPANVDLKLEIVATVGNATADGFLATITSGALTINCTTGAATANGFLATVVNPYWPLPSQVQAGVVYGPTGADYTGTYVDSAIKYDLTTGRLVKPINSKVVMSL